METVPRKCDRCSYPILVIVDPDMRPVLIDGNSGNYEITKECPGCGNFLEHWQLED